MKHGALWATVGALTLALTAHAITVDGYVYLRGQTHHTGTLIRFTAVSPSGRTDSTQSASSGYYQIVLELGVYDVEFAHAGYVSYRRYGQVLFVDTSLAAATLCQGIFGPQSGTLTRGTYDVTDTLRVAAGQTWALTAGTQLLFRPRIPLTVSGAVVALGTVQDSIIFAPRIESPDSAWGGIQFLNAVGTSHLDYCVIERARGRVMLTPLWPEEVGALTCLNSSPTVEHSSIRNNHGADFGAGAYWRGGAPVFRDCEFGANYAALSGSGTAIFGSAGLMERCRFDETYGNAIYCDDSATTRFTECSILASFDWAIWCREAGPVMDRCLIVGYEAIRCWNATPRLSRCTVVGDMSFDESDPVINSSILYSATVSLEPGSGSQITYCAAYRVAGLEYGPPGLGVLVLTNANGDSCDTYYNIFLDPQFVDTAAGDYHLRAGSPCIDAGDPNLPRDPDGTVADMGAFYFNQLGVSDPERTAVRGYELLQNYPNPFNAETRIAFDLPRAGEVKLEVFDITGRLVRTLVNGRVPQGRHEVNLDARDLPSGVYVYRLAAGDAIEAKKMVLIR